MVSEETLLRVQALVPDSDNQALLEVLEKRLGTVEVKPKARRGKARTDRADPKPISEFNSLKASFTPYSRPIKLPFGPEDFPSLQAAHSEPRPRANTDTFRPRKFSSPKHEAAPVISWTRPGKESAPVDFTSVQAQQKARDLSVNPWGTLSVSSRQVPEETKSIVQIQEEEREEAELQEALRLIAEMEARELMKHKAKPPSRRRRKQTT